MSNATQRCGDLLARCLAHLALAVLDLGIAGLGDRRWTPDTHHDR
ncbi:hypothetical protein [Cupriavidus pauculus]|nr:hypothetical protein [Cupriavidus pauculus]GJG96742.1 hypothetical protein CBA19C6_19655 [Cupriavidus pauculus]